MNAATITPPYLPTTHAWRCNAGHEITLNDRGWPQTPGFKASVLRAWGKYKHGDELRCPECGGKAEYKTEFAPASAPVLVVAPPVPLLPPAPVRNYGEEYDKIPCTPGGMVAALREAGRKGRRR